MPWEGPACQVRLARLCPGGRGPPDGDWPGEGAPVSFLRKQESRKNNWIPAFGGMTYKGETIGPAKHPPPFGSHGTEGERNAGTGSNG